MTSSASPASPPPPSSRPPGPVDDRQADRIIEATLQLMREGGGSAVTTDAIARRANVGKTTIYRRWRDRSEVLVAAVRRVIVPVMVEDAGSLSAEVRTLLEARLEQYADPGVARIFGSIVGAMVDDQQVADAFRDGWAFTQRQRNVAMFERAVTRGELDPKWRAEDLATIIGAPLLFRMIVEGRPADQQLIDTVVEVVTSLLRTDLKEGAEQGSGMPDQSRASTRPRKRVAR